MGAAYMEGLCKFAGLYGTLPDCSDPLELEQFNIYDDVGPEVICEYFRERLIINRVYFSLAMVNMAYVISSTALLIHRARAVQRNEKNLRFPVKESQVRTLRERNLLALAIGESGHLMIISVSIIIKALDGCIYCPTFMYITTYGYYLWISSFIWRAYYLRFQLSLHKIKLQLGHGESRKDRDWYIHNKDMHSISNGRFFLLLLCGLVLLTIPLVLMHRYYYGFDHSVAQSCSTRLGTIVLLCMVTFCQCIISPILVFLLRNDRDAHNLRNELIAICVVGIPTSVLYLVWVTVVPASFSFDGPRDFSTENVLFCEQYSVLANKTMDKLNKKQVIHEKPPNVNYTSLTSDPIPHELQTDYIAFYNTFIKAGAPLQVNIAYSDRKTMDAVFKDYARRERQILENVVSEVRLNEDDTWGGEELVLFASVADSKRSTTSVNEDPLIDQPSAGSSIRCNVFDHARKEVMWIIFCNILPKFIEDCK
ncbi:unnamed protein product [Umbelopsis ramanniana]